MMTNPNWRTGAGYPRTGASLDAWEHEFFRRGEAGLKGRPHFNLDDGTVEFFVGPATIQIEDDGSILSAPAANRSNINRMVLEFQLDQDIETQIERARKWLTGAQKKRFDIEKRKFREDKYRTYLRAFDGSFAGFSNSEIAKILYPYIPDEYPDHQGSKQVSKDIATAKKLAIRGLRTNLIRR